MYIYSFTFIKYYSYSLYFLSFHFIGNRIRNSTLIFIHSARATIEKYVGHVFFAVSIIIIIIIFYLPSAVFIALTLLGPSKWLSQIIEIKNNRLRIPTGQRQTSWAIYKRGQGFELGTTVNKSSQRSEWDLNSGPPNCKSSALTTRLSCLLLCNLSRQITRFHKG